MKTYSDELKASLIGRMLPPQEASVSELSRESGIPKDTLVLLAGAGPAPEQANVGWGSAAKRAGADAQADRRRIRELEQELNRKDKALAETAALLVLRKKAQAIWGEGEAV